MKAIVTAVFVFVMACPAWSAAIVSPQFRWPAGEIPFVFSPKFSNPVHVRTAMDFWHQRLGTQIFRPKRSDDQHWLEVDPEPDMLRPPCRSEYAGFQRNEPIVRIYLRERSASVLIKDACSIENVIHELGHVLGLEHEHQRCDARVYMSFSPFVAGNVRADDIDGWIRGQYETFSCLDPTVENFGPYDFLSLMHYDPFDQTACAQSTCLPFVLTPTGSQELQKLGLNNLLELSRYRHAHDCAFDTSCISDGDVRAVKHMYSLP